MELTKIILNLLNEDSRRPIVGKTRFQKLIFLIEQRAQLKNGESFHFTPYKYGPYSEELNNTINKLIIDKKIKLKQIKVNDFEVNEYSITENGEKEIETANSGENEKALLEVIKSTKSQFNGIELRKLIMYVYSTYPKFVMKH